MSRSPRLLRRFLLLAVVLLTLVGGVSATRGPAARTCSAQANPFLPCCSCDNGGPSPCYDCSPHCGLSAK
ncbi:MAG TPA: hypothetical protein VGX48_03615 [Pyrinomonadaceae bacterium]|jgi:hypothetical protein|nr:hypothetical protein [Pyrinomonadaceae bacterium]